MLPIGASGLKRNCTQRDTGVSHPPEAAVSHNVLLAGAVGGRETAVS